MDRTLGFMVLLLPIAILLASHHVAAKHIHTHAASGYSFQVTRIHQSLPAIDSQIGRSVFDYNYNAAWLPLFNASQSDALLVRCQYNTSSSVQPPNPYAVGPSQLAIAPFSMSSLVFDKIVSDSVVFNATEPYEQLGTEDPRVVYRASNGVYYMLYSAVQDVNGTTICRLALATSLNPSSYSNWTRYGPIFPDVNGFQWTKSGSLLVRDGFTGPSYLFYGDSSYVPGLQLALTNDLIHYQQVPGVWMPVRNDSFDSTLVEAGPYPIMLSDGNYLFLYNSARSGYTSPKPGYDLQYNVGWAILDGKDPTKIIARCDEPILTPTLAWETGKPPFLGLTPNVVFVEGWRAVGVDTFMIFYGAADSVIGVALVKVTVPQQQHRGK